MARPPHDQLSKRERQIMDALYRLGEGSAGDVHEAIDVASGDSPSANTIRVTLSILEKKGHVRHERDGRRYVYKPAAGAQQVRVRALRHLVNTFFGESAPHVVSTLIGDGKRVSDEELDELARLIEDERRARAQKRRR